MGLLISFLVLGMVLLSMALMTLGGFVMLWSIVMLVRGVFGQVSAENLAQEPTQNLGYGTTPNLACERCSRFTDGCRCVTEVRWDDGALVEVGDELLVRDVVPTSNGKQNLNHLRTGLLIALSYNPDGELIYWVDCFPEGNCETRVELYPEQDRYELVRDPTPQPRALLTLNRVFVHGRMRTATEYNEQQNFQFGREMASLLQGQDGEQVRIGDTWERVGAKKPVTISGLWITALDGLPDHVAKRSSSLRQASGFTYLAQSTTQISTSVGKDARLQLSELFPLEDLVALVEPSVLRSQQSVSVRDDLCRVYLGVRPVDGRDVAVHLTLSDIDTRNCHETARCCSV